MATQSRNSRGSRTEESARGGSASVKSLIPLGGGTGAYVVHPTL